LKILGGTIAQLPPSGCRPEQHLGIDQHLRPSNFLLRKEWMASKRISLTLSCDSKKFKPSLATFQQTIGIDFFHFNRLAAELSGPSEQKMPNQFEKCQTS